MSPESAWPPGAACDSARQCILVVEDELLIRFMLSDGLRDAGFHVVEACDADEALVIMQTTLPDLIMSDVRMSGSLDGLELLALVRSSHPKLPVVIVSGHAEPERAIAAGATQFLRKPFTIERVIQAVQSELAK